MNKRGRDIKEIIKNNLYMLKYISKYCPKYIFVTIAIGLISSILRLTSTYYTKLIVDSMEVKGTIQRLFVIILSMIVINISFSSLINWLNNYISIKYSFHLNYRMSLDIFKKLKEMDYENYHDTEFFNKVMKSIEQSDLRAKSVLNSMTTLITNILNIGAFSVIISIYNPVLFIFAIVSVIFSLFFSSVLSKIQYNSYNANIKYGRQRDYIRRIYFLENYAKEIRMNEGLTEILEAKFEDSTNSLVSETLKYSKQSLKYSFLQIMVSNLLSSFITLFLGKRVMNKSIKLSDYFFISSSVGQLVDLLTTLFNILPKLYEDNLYISDYLEFINSEPKIKNIKDVKTIDKIRNICFDNVHFIYPKTNIKVLSSISLDVRIGEKILIIGRNGSGKSTLIKLLCRLYDVSEGNILIDGISIKDIFIKNVRSKIGIVFQDFEIYATTITENILMRPIEDDVKDALLVKKALKTTGLWDKVSKLEKGIYSTLSREFEENGIIFSGGERQLLAVCRMFVQDYDVIIFDEPFSALDPITEAELANKIVEIFQNKTVIIISHRIANIKNIGKIIYIENGKIEETGTHKELYNANNKYKRIYDAQNGI